MADNVISHPRRAVITEAAMERQVAETAAQCGTLPGSGPHCERWAFGRCDGGGERRHDNANYSYDACCSNLRT